MSYRLAIFDFDGTLADSARWFVEAFNALAPRYGYRPVSEGEVEDLRGLSAREIMARLGVSAWKLPMIAASLRRRMAREAPSIRLFDDIEDVLHTLHRAGVACAVVSSNAEVNVRRTLGPEVARSISHFACGASLFGKARHFRKVMKRAGVHPAHTLCIGDEQRDIDAARQVGAHSGAVLWGYASPAALTQAGATHVFERPAEIALRLAGGVG